MKLPSEAELIEMERRVLGISAHDFAPMLKQDDVTGKWRVEHGDIREERVRCDVVRLFETVRYLLRERQESKCQSA